MVITRQGISLSNISGSSTPQSLDQAVLKLLKETFDMPFGLGRVGRDEVDPYCRRIPAWG